MCHLNNFLSQKLRPFRANEREKKQKKNYDLQDYDDCLVIAMVTHEQQNKKIQQDKMKNREKAIERCNEIIMHEYIS